MVIEKNSSKVALDMEFHSPRSRDSIMSSEDDEDVQRRNCASAVESDDDDDDFDECDSGAGSDDFDLLELGESGEEFCQIGDQTCSIPYELYDLPDLKNVLSMEVWNDVLTEEDRFSLSKYLPDMDQENYVQTLKELFSGDNLHFGSPTSKLFDMLKGGMCEPRVAMYTQGLNFLQRRKHYHHLRKYQNTMVRNFCHIRDAWRSCSGYSIEEKIHMLNMMKSQKSLMNENIEELVSEPSDKYESNMVFWGQKNRNLGQKTGRYSALCNNPPSDIPYHGQCSTLEPAFKVGKRNPKGSSKLARLKATTVKETPPSLPSHSLGIRMKSHRYGGSAALMMKDIVEDEEPGQIFDRNLLNLSARADENFDSYMGFPTSSKANALGRNKTINKLSDITVLTVKPSGGGKKFKQDENFRQIATEDQMKHARGLKSNVSLKGRRPEIFGAEDPTWLSKHPEFFPADFHSNSKILSAKSKHWDNGNDVSDRVGTFLRYEDAASDLSEHADEDEDENPLMGSKWAYPSGVPVLKQGSNAKNKLKKSKKDKKANSILDGSSHLSGKNFSGTPDVTKSEKRGKMSNGRYFNILPSKDMGESQYTELGNEFGAEDQWQMHGMGPNGCADADDFRMPSKKSSINLGKSRKGSVADNGALTSGKRNQFVELSAEYQHDRSELALTGCNTNSKKRKLRKDLDHLGLPDNDDGPQGAADLQLENMSSVKKRGKMKLDGTSDILENGVPQQPAMEFEMEDVEAVTKRQKKSLPLITPSVPNNFSFSVIHLLSAVRMAMCSLLPDASDAGKYHGDVNSEGGVKEEQASKPDGIYVASDPNMEVSTPPANENVPSLTVLEIINRVKSNPGDPCILETQEPLQDLIRGVLKIFSSRTAPLGAKGWKPLVVYEKSKKSWSWVGPVSNGSPDREAVEEVTSPDAWGLPPKMLVKLVDSFANWLKNSQETLKQIGSLPSPPLTLMQIKLDEKERFKDLRAQKSLSTISTSSEEVRAYFRKEEELRYQIPDRAFSYTAVDGKKSIVAPLRRCGGKPTSKARDHFMLKPDRPPHVTVLCLVRDAASRLPGSIGTRADVCTLIRDSQYIVEDVSDSQVNQVISGALDRLHYERDPCVQFDSERKLWVYLHREREEEDFEDDGTSSTKKWRRQKKETNEPMESGDAAVAYAGNVGQSGPDLVSDLNAEAFADDDKRSEHDGNEQLEDNVESPDCSRKRFATPETWNCPEFIPGEASKLLSQEISAVENFEDDTFGEPPPA